jgi:OpgC protein
MLALSDATLAHMKANLSAIRLLHFLSVAVLVATYVKKSSAILSWPGASAIIKSGRCSLQVFCLGAIISVVLNLFVAVDTPFLFERLLLDAAAVLAIVLTVTLLMKRRQERGLSTGLTT